jgi:hypothetical protein
MATINLTEAAFEETLKVPGIVLVDFTPTNAAMLQSAIDALGSGDRRVLSAALPVLDRLIALVDAQSEAEGEVRERPAGPLAHARRRRPPGEDGAQTVHHPGLVADVGAGPGVRSRAGVAESEHGREAHVLNGVTSTSTSPGGLGRDPPGDRP